MNAISLVYFGATNVNHMEFMKSCNGNQELISNASRFHSTIVVLANWERGTHLLLRFWSIWHAQLFWLTNQILDIASNSLERSMVSRSGILCSPQCVRCALIANSMSINLIAGEHLFNASGAFNEFEFKRYISCRISILILSYDNNNNNILMPWKNISISKINK